jgi:TRAP-type C4-dicarboxylate transport system permease small subunit
LETLAYLESRGRRDRLHSAFSPGFRIEAYDGCAGDPMRKLISLLDKWITYTSQSGGAIGCALIIITAAIITINSFSRYIFNHPFLFVDEYARYMLVALFYLGLGFTLRAGKHVSADVIVRRFSKRTQIALNVITSSFGSIVIYLMLWNSWKSFYSVYKTKMVSLTPLETPLWIPYLFVAVGLTLFLLDMLAHIGHGIKEFIREGR